MVALAEYKFIFDGKDMYLIGACAIWNTNDT